MQSTAAQAHDSAAWRASIPNRGGCSDPWADRKLFFWAGCCFSASASAGPLRPPHDEVQLESFRSRKQTRHICKPTAPQDTMTGSIIRRMDTHRQAGEGATVGRLSSYLARKLLKQRGIRMSYSTQTLRPLSAEYST